MIISILNKIHIMESLDLSALSISDNKIQHYETISELFLIIYSFEDPDISFEKLHEKFINFYIYEAPDICTFIHKNEIINIHNFNNLNLSNLDFILNFLNSSYGITYLHEIFKYK